MKGWLLQLAEAQDGTLQWQDWLRDVRTKFFSFHLHLAALTPLRSSFGRVQWQDFLPSCKICQRTLSPVLEGESEPCPVCESREGKCFQFICQKNSLALSCGRMRPESRQAYCGSHPFFGGYMPGDQCCGSFGQPLFQKTRRFMETDIDFIATARRKLLETKVDIFSVCHTGITDCNTSLQISVWPGRQSIISSSTWKEHEILPRISGIFSAMVHIPKDHAAADVILLQHRHGPSNHYIAQCRLDDSEDESEDQDFWPDWANVTGENDSLNFNQQIVELPQHVSWCGQ